MSGVRSLRKQFASEVCSSVFVSEALRDTRNKFFSFNSHKRVKKCNILFERRLFLFYLIWENQYK